MLYGVSEGAHPDHAGLCRKGILVEGAVGVGQDHLIGPAGLLRDGLTLQLHRGVCLGDDHGPILAGTVKQFWSEVYWNDVDYMFVDMPPGTGDVPLTIFQSLPLDGIIIVTSPQELVSMIVEKAVKMAQMMNIPILGIIENMSCFVCPDCGKKHYPFGESKLEEIAKEYGLDILGRLPIDAKNSAACDSGKIEGVLNPEAEEAAKKIEALLKI